MEKKICPIMSNVITSGTAELANCVENKCAMWRLDKSKKICTKCGTVFDDHPLTCKVCEIDTVKHVMGYCGIAGKY